MGSSRSIALPGGLGGAGLVAGVLIAAVGAFLVTDWGSVDVSSLTQADLAADVVQLASALRVWALASPGESWGLILLGVGLVGAGVFVRRRTTRAPQE